MTSMNVTPFPSLEAALGTIMLRSMSEAMTTDTPPDRMAKLEALRVALKAVWPEEIKTALARTVWAPGENGGTRAMYSGDEA